jgi:predicted DCC family thiol-disulfide oxidoreductase YuxK
LSAVNRSNREREQWQIRVLFDGECPLCRREIRMLERLDRGRGYIDLEDISQPGFDPAAYGLDGERVMAQIHGVLPDGSAIEGLEVFRRVYAAVGLGWLMAPTRWPLLRDVSEAGYRIFARNRLRWTGRESACGSDRCHLPARPSEANPGSAQP